MKTKLFKTVSLVCGVGMAFSALSFTACREEKVSNDDNTLEVYLWDAGYGTAWLDDMLEDFGKLDYVKEKYPNYQYHTTYNDDQGFSANRIGMGETNTIDLFFGCELDQILGDDSKLVELSDLLEQNVLGEEDVTVKEKMRGDVLEFLEWRALDDDESVDPKYYSIPWSMSTGTIVYNETLFSALGLTVPHTTDEMLALMEKVKQLNGTNSAYPYSHTLISSKVSYAGYMFLDWWAQYEGEEGYTNFFEAINYKGVRNSPDVLKQTGRLESMRVFEKMDKSTAGYFDPTSIEFDFIAGQGRLLMGQGLMMMNGDWFNCEMSELADEYRSRGYDYVIGAMRTPVISAIVNKTPSVVATATAQGKTNDQILSMIISEIDNGATSSAIQGVTQADFDIIRAARGAIYSGGVSSQTVVPAYATAKNLALDFLRYFASDRANEIYTVKTMGGRLGFKYDLKTANPAKYNEVKTDPNFKVQLDVSNYLAESHSWILPLESNFRFVRYGGFSSMSGFGNIEVQFMNNSELTAEDMINKLYDYWTANNNARWNLALQNAGMV